MAATWTRTERAEHARLAAAWAAAVALKDRTGHPVDEAAEEDAYTAVCDYFDRVPHAPERLDPRGTMAEHDAMSGAGMSDTAHRITVGWRTNRDPRLAPGTSRLYSPRCSCGWERLTESLSITVARTTGAMHVADQADGQ